MAIGVSTKVIVILIRHKYVFFNAIERIKVILNLFMLRDVVLYPTYIFLLKIKNKL